MIFNIFLVKTCFSYQHKVFLILKMMYMIKTIVFIKKKEMINK